MNKNKLKNPLFYISLISILCASINLNIESLTSWSLLFECFIDIVNNPFKILCLIVAFIGVWNDNSTIKLDNFIIKGGGKNNGK